MSPAALSQVLSGKRNFSRKNLARVAKALRLPPEFLDRQKSSCSEAAQIRLDIFSLIAEWHHFAILNLVEVDSIKSVSQISKRLGISEKTATSAVERLLSLGFLLKTQNSFRRSQPSQDTGTDIPSEALRKHNREKMELAIESLEKTPLAERDISSLTLPFNMKKMVKIKEEIKRFKKRINQLCSGDQYSEVYSLNIQFFPLSKKETQE